MTSHRYSPTPEQRFWGLFAAGAAAGIRAKRARKWCKTRRKHEKAAKIRNITS